MYVVTVNGKRGERAEDMRLIDYLRQVLHLGGTKDGCSAGACGACTVIVNGKKTKACLPKLSQIDGQEVITIEGLSQRERDVYVYAFGKCGAVQCGFCIPGMVMSAKALLDGSPTPTAEDIKKALIGNICRCTGYVKIEEAIALAAQMLRDGSPIPNDMYEGKIGQHIPRVDVQEKVLGTGQYTDDVIVDGMVYAMGVRLPCARAHIEKIDYTQAQTHPDFIACFTAKDVPFNKCGHIVPDWDVLIAEGDTTRYMGDAVALVVGKNNKTLREIASMVDVTYEELTPVSDPFAAMASGAPQLHENGNILAHKVLHRGDVEKAISEAAHVVTRKYYTPQTDHAFMEPECAIAVPQNDGSLLVYSGDQGIYDDQHEISRMLAIEPEKVRIHSMLVGGGFGGKEDMSVQHHAALAAWLTKLPVKVLFTRQDSINYHVKRHAMYMEVTTACDKEGNITGSKIDIVSDCGAYASLGGPVLERACTHAGGPYHYDNFSAEGTCVYTNNVPGGAYRGFGVTQSCFAQECNIDLLAAEVGMDPWEFRYKNAVRPGESLPNGQIAGPETALVECLEAIKPVYEANPTAGLAACMKNSGIGVGLPDIGRVNIAIRDGKCHLRSSAACIGQGVGTVVKQIACTITGLPEDVFIMDAPDTTYAPDSGTTTASRQTLFAGEAARLSAELLKQALEEKTLAELEGEIFCGEFSGVTDPMGSPKEHPVSHVAYGFGACVATLDEAGKVTNLEVAYDVGRVINPRSCEGQAEGGAIMGMGFALTENVKYENSIVKSTYGTLGLLRSNQCPPIGVHLIEKAAEDAFAFGAKGIGEISSIPIAPAIANAYRRRDGIERRELPLAQTAYRK